MDNPLGIPLREPLHPDIIPSEPSAIHVHKYMYPEEHITKLSQIPDSPQSDEPPLPTWLSPPDPKPTPLSRFADSFEWVCNRLAEGESLSQVLNRDPRSPDVGKFIRWVMADEGRREQYEKALQGYGEVMFMEDMLRIADGDDTLEDVQRTKVRLETRWKMLAVCNRKRFGDIKQIEQNVTIDLGEAMEKARNRVIDVTPGNRYE